MGVVGAGIYLAVRYEVRQLKSSTMQSGKNLNMMFRMHIIPLSSKAIVLEAYVKHFYMQLEIIEKRFPDLGIESRPKGIKNMAKEHEETLKKYAHYMEELSKMDFQSPIDPLSM